MQSMTGFATVDGVTAESAPVGWRWEARSVNGRGLDVKLRLPPGFEALEADWRARIGRRFARGVVSLSLSLTETAAAAPSRLDPLGLIAALEAVAEAERAAQARGLDLRPASVDGVLRLPGVFASARPGGASGEPEPARSETLIAAVSAGLEQTLDALAAARASEGAALATVLEAHLDTVAALTEEAARRAAARAAGAAERLREKVAEILAAAAGGAVDPARLAQELALLAVKADIREEIDRLRAHLAAARALAAETAPIGRRFDFLTQEFNREANTLCAKSQDPALTETGLALKATIDQIKEQAANVE